MAGILNFALSNALKIAHTDQPETHKKRNDVHAVGKNDIRSVWLSVNQPMNQSIHHPSNNPINHSNHEHKLISQSANSSITIGRPINQSKNSPAVMSCSTRRTACTRLFEDMLRPAATHAALSTTPVTSAVSWQTLAALVDRPKYTRHASTILAESTARLHTSSAKDEI